MNKIFILLIIAVLLRVPLSSQTTTWQENFNEPPPGWTLEGNWGFTYGDLMLYYYPVYTNFDFSAYSPAIVIPEDGGTLSLNHFIEPYFFGITDEMCEVIVIADGNETILWSHQLSDGAWGVIGGMTLNLSLDLFSGKEVMVKLRATGQTTEAFWGWTVYDAEINTNFDYDLMAIDVTGPANVLPDVSGEWNVTVKNIGIQDVQDFQVKLYSFKNVDEIASENYYGIVGSGETVSLTLQWIPDEIHNTCLYAKVLSTVDEFPVNNISKSSFVRVFPEMPYNILVWDHDNGIPTVFNPDTGEEEQPDASITRALTKAGIEFNMVQDLPADLSGYDLILCTMGSYCLS